MSEIRRLFLQMKKKCLLSRQDSDQRGETKTRTTTTTIACRKDEDEEKGSVETKKRGGGGGSIRRTPDLIKSHPQTKLPPLPPNQNSSFHGIIRGYPPVSGHIYEEISTAVAAAAAAAAVVQSGSGELPGGRGGVFYISPIDGAMHRLHPEHGDWIVCPHLRCCSESGTPPSPAPFAPRLFGKTVSVCENCARSLRERLASSSEPDVIYPTYWRPTDTGRSGVRNRHPSPHPPPPALPPFPELDAVQSDSGNSERIGTADEEQFCQGLRDSVVRSRPKMAASVDSVVVLDKLSCRATNYRPPRPETGSSSSSRSDARGHRFSRSPHEDRTAVATSRSMTNLLLSDVLRLNHDRRFLFGNLQFSSNES